VPDGLVLEPGAVDDAVLTGLVPQVARWGGHLAVRSSAIGEDGASASFAGQHVTRLGVRATEGALRSAIRAVTASAGSPHALAYRRAMDSGAATTGLAVPVAVLIQPLVPAEVSGVLFTRDPVSGADQVVVEAARGLGEAVVTGRVTPEQCRMTRAGAVLEHRPGRQEAAVVAAGAGGTEERPVDPTAGLSLTASLLADLADLAARCREVFDADALDLEWAMSDGRLFLLQCRPVTT
jgi:pyruvate,water dikinase